jgi:hypothetical protein
MKRSLKNNFFIMTFALMLGACGGIDGQKYVDQSPAFDLREYFTGPVKAWGMIQDRSGNITRKFDIDLVGTWQGNEGELVEDFRYYDGETQRRVLRLTDLGNGQFEVRADDIVGVGTAMTFGNAMNLNYTMALELDSGTVNVDLEDWIWAMNDGVIINRADIKKFGITVAEITIFMKKE